MHRDTNTTTEITHSIRLLADTLCDRLLHEYLWLILLSHIIQQVVHRQCFKTHHSAKYIAEDSVPHKWVRVHPLHMLWSLHHFKAGLHPHSPIHIQEDGL